jgi:hypothetical protein
VAYDPDLNWLIFDVANYSMKNIDHMLEKYDVPIPQVRLTIRVCEIDVENDQKLGLDFQAWKNNDGMDFFSAGGRFRDNWAASFGGTLMNSGSERTRFFNFNPKWNTRYIDLLFSSGKAKVVHSAEMIIRNNTSAVLDRTTQIFYMDTQTPANNTISDPARLPYKLLSTLIGEAIDRFCNERTARMKDCETMFPAMAEMLVEMAERIVADKKRSEFFMLMQTGLKWTDAPLAGLARKIFEERVNGPYHAVMDALAADKLAGRVRSDIDAHEISASVMALFDGLIRRKIEGFLFSDMAKTMKSSYLAIYQSIKI